MNSLLVSPYGGKLVDLLVRAEERESLLRKAVQLPSVQLSPRSYCDLEMLATGALSPLDRFMAKADYDSTLEKMRLANGALYPIPVTLPVTDTATVGPGREVVLRSPKNEPVAIMLVEEVFGWDPSREALKVCGTVDGRHPLVSEMSSLSRFYASGPLKVIDLPNHYDFPGLRRSPAEIRNLLEELGRPNVVAFPTQDQIHRAHEDLTKRTAERFTASLLLHPVVGIAKPGDIDYYTRVRTYLTLFERYYHPREAVLNLLPLVPRTAGLREAIWHAIIQRNYGANHLLVAHSAVEGSLEQYSQEIGVQIETFNDMVYLPGEGRYEQAHRVTPENKTLAITEAEVRTDYLAAGRALPEWYVRPEVAQVLSQAYPPRRQQGLCVWFTGLPSAGKSTIAEILAVMLMEHGRRVTVLDGDVVRTHLSKGLGFSKEDRDANILRIGFVASEIARHHGAVICAAVSPYDATRNRVRSMVGEDRFVLVYVATPIEVCEQRDVKRLYARARAGELKGFTGVDDPYEPPANPDIILTTTDASPEQSARTIILELTRRGFLSIDAQVAASS